MISDIDYTEFENFTKWLGATQLRILPAQLKLTEIVVEIPFFAARRAHEHQIAIRRTFCEDIKIPEKNSSPSVKMLLLLRLLSLTFPCFDFHHPVITPTILLMCEYLVRCPIVYGRDVAVGSFLCSMVLSAIHITTIKKVNNKS